MDAIALRPAGIGDATALGALHVASWRETYAGILPDAMLAELSAEARAAMWGRIIADPDGFGGAIVFVAEIADAIAGFGCCGGQRDETLRDAGFAGEINALYLLRSHHRQGAGRAIMAAMADALLAVGHTGASLWVLRENQAARSFYETLGGQIVGEKMDERPDGTLAEIAYGWPDLKRIAAVRHPAQRGKK